MKITVQAGQHVTLGTKDFVVSELAAASLPSLRVYLIGVARAGGIVTYGEVVRDLELDYSAQGVGFLLDVLSVDCEARHEPLLAALVVHGTTFESADFPPDEAEAERDLVYRHWLSKAMEA